MSYWKHCEKSFYHFKCFCSEHEIINTNIDYEMIHYETISLWNETMKWLTMKRMTMNRYSPPMHANTPPHTMQKMHMQPNASARIPHDTVMNQNEYK